MADRDLFFQDFSLVLVPGNRLNCLPRARRERAALRAHREEIRLNCLPRARRERAALRAHREEPRAICSRLVNFFRALSGRTSQPGLLQRRVHPRFAKVLPRIPLIVGSAA